MPQLAPVVRGPTFVAGPGVAPILGVRAGKRK